VRFGCASVRSAPLVGMSGTYERTNFVQKVRPESASDIEICTTVQSCAKVQNSCAT